MHARSSPSSRFESFQAPLTRAHTCEAYEADKDDCHFVLFIDVLRRGDQSKDGPEDREDNEKRCVREQVDVGVWVKM